jgi:hypothetical protein
VGEAQCFLSTRALQWITNRHLGRSFDLGWYVSKDAIGPEPLQSRQMLNQSYQGVSASGPEGGRLEAGNCVKCRFSAPKTDCIQTCQNSVAATDRPISGG